MPLYDFRCSSCDLDFEVSRSFATADEPALCPFCSRPAVRQVTLPMSVYTKGAAAERTLSSPSPGRESASWYHHGNSHGSGSGSHSH